VDDEKEEGKTFVPIELRCCDLKSVLLHVRI